MTAPFANPSVQNCRSRAMMEQLKRIKETTNHYPAQPAEKLNVGGRPRSELALTRMHSRQNQIFRALDLAMFLAS